MNLGSLLLYLLKKLRRNFEIRALAVRVIGEKSDQSDPDRRGGQAGVMPREKAIEYAASLGLDLVEVSPKALPPVCKVMDYGKYLYKLKKLDQHQKKSSKQTEVKGVRLGLSTGLHDLEVKARSAEKFLKGKNIIKVSLIFKGREAAHADLGREKMLQFAGLLHEVADMEGQPRMQGQQMHMILNPKK